MANKKVKYFIVDNYYNKKEVEGVIKTFDECPDEQWGFSKTASNLWVVTHINSGFQATTGDTQKECIERLKTLLSNKENVKYIKKLKDMDTAIAIKQEEFGEKAIKNKKFQKLREEFKQITGITCPIDPILCSVDIVKLDKMIKTPDDMSMSDYLKMKYGDRANEIIDEMIS